MLKVGSINLSKRKAKGGFLVTLGYMLSPLSWWNDLFFNLPIAYVFAYIVGLISKSLFAPSLVIAYWITNILGFVFMHKGASNIVSKEKEKYTRNDFFKDFCVSVVYTLMIVFLVIMGVLKMPTEYLC